MFWYLFINWTRFNGRRKQQTK